MRCPSFAVPSVSELRICVWPRVNRPEPCARGLTPTSISIARISSVPRPSGRRFSIAIFLRTRSL